MYAYIICRVSCLPCLFV